MSDFINDFWPVYVTVLTLAGVIGCLLLLWITARKKIVSAADNTTGHVWDGDLVEMNNPMPRWWMWLFVITIVFGLGYLAAYPGLGRFAGKLGWTQLGEYQAEVDKANAELEPLYARFANMKPEDMKDVSDEDMIEFIQSQFVLFVGVSPSDVIVVISPPSSGTEHSSWR